MHLIEMYLYSPSLFDTLFQPIVDFLAVVLFFKIGSENGFPFIVLWLFVAAIFFTIRRGFINLLGCYILSNEVAGDFRDYWSRLTSGKMTMIES